MIPDNMMLLTTKAKLLNVIEAKNPTELLIEFCCDETNEECLQRTCSRCSSKSFKIKEVEKDSQVTYDKWFSKNFELVIKGPKKMSKTVKERI